MIFHGLFLECERLGSGPFVCEERKDVGGGGVVFSLARWGMVVIRIVGGEWDGCGT